GNLSVAGRKRGRGIGGSGGGGGSVDRQGMTGVGGSEIVGGAIVDRLDSVGTAQGASGQRVIGAGGAGGDIDRNPFSVPCRTTENRASFGAFADGAGRAGHGSAKGDSLGAVSRKRGRGVSGGTRTGGGGDHQGMARVSGGEEVGGAAVHRLDGIRAPQGAGG